MEYYITLLYIKSRYSTLITWDGINDVGWEKQRVDERVRSYGMVKPCMCGIIRIYLNKYEDIHFNKSPTSDPMTITTVIMTDSIVSKLIYLILLHKAWHSKEVAMLT